MEVIKLPSNIIQKQLKVPIIESTPRWIQYIYRYDIDNSILLFNTLNNALVKLTYEEYDNGLDNELLRNLLFVVDEEYPDYEVYDYLYSNFRLDNKLDIFNKLNSYVILSTTKCNARCKYCYENGIKRINMLDKVVDNIIKLMKINYSNNKKELDIKLFGGEPLLNQSVFDKIFIELKNENIPYYSNIITNGYLINAKLVNKMKTLYNIHLCQITIDGTEDNYNSIKNYKNAKYSPFKRVLENINILIDNNINVNIRINFDLNNKDDIYLLLEQLLNKYKDNKLVKIYTHHIFNKYTDEDANILLNTYKDYINIINSKSNNYINDTLCNYHCMVSTVANILIDPEGNIYKCENLPKNGIIGNINDIFDNNQQLDQDKFNNFYLTENNFDECKTCKFKPYCIRLKICDCIFDDKCDIIKKYDLEQDLINKILNEYNRYKKGRT